jgi:hypothetical protein
MASTSQNRSRASMKDGVTIPTLDSVEVARRSERGNLSSDAFDATSRTWVGCTWLLAGVFFQRPR